MTCTLRQARPEEARAIARLIMEAMSPECCQYIAGPAHTLACFEDAMTRLVAREDSQYSYQNTLVAIAGEEVIGIATSYDGKDLHTLRKAFIEEALRSFSIDYSGMTDETQAGELYLDSLAVDARFRHQGIATALLRATMEKARRLRLPAVGLLVDRGNPTAERLYRSLGFHSAGPATWASHPMLHLVCEV